MKFTDLLIEKNKDLKPILSEKEEDAESLLRSKGFKIKLVTKTAFGVQIDFAKQYDEEDIKDALKDFNIKLKGKSVFILK